jgi:hypothetical protein
MVALDVVLVVTGGLVMPHHERSRRATSVADFSCAPLGQVIPTTMIPLACPCARLALISV